MKYAQPFTTSAIAHTIFFFLFLPSVVVVDAYADMHETRPAWSAHGFLAILAFCGFVPLAIASSILRKEVFQDDRRSWFQIHFWCNIVAYVVTFMTFMIAYSTEVRQGDKQHFVGGHHAMGLAIMVLMTIQVLGGLIRPEKKVETQEKQTEMTSTSSSPGQMAVEGEGEEGEHSLPTPQEHHRSVTAPSRPYDKSNIIRYVWGFGHKFLGSIIFVCAVWQINRGLKMYTGLYGNSGLPLVAAFWTWLFVCAIGVVILKIYPTRTP